MPEVNVKLAIISLMLINGTVSVLDTNWWKHAIIYEVYIPSFKDSNGDGIGDIKGITEKLDHFVDLDIPVIYLTPFFKSPMSDFGYDISNYIEVDELFGTMQDFDELIEEMNKRGLKLIIDVVINHSSDEHPWFIKSVDRIEPYTDFYVWQDAKGFDRHGHPIPPNNWLSIFTQKSAWQWNEKRGQFYLHQFSIKQPDLNLRNNELKKNIKAILKFWMDRGVSGFRLDAPWKYMEDKMLRNEPVIPAKDRTSMLEYYSLDHIYTANLWENCLFIHELRTFVDQYGEKKKEKHERILIAEVFADMNGTMAYYGAEQYPIAHFPFNFGFVLETKFKNASAFNNRITSWLKNMPKGAVANWVTENHDYDRIGTNYNEEYMDIVTITIMTLPGVACVYYGQEIGMTNGKVRADQRQDPNLNPETGDNRDGSRLPMPWDDTANSGFTSRSKPWLPVVSNYWKINVETQKSDRFSRYNLFKTLSRLRGSKTMKWGLFQSHIVSEWVYAFTRSLRRHETYITILNLGTETEMIDLHAFLPDLPKSVEVVAASLNAGYVSGDEIQSRPRFPNTLQMRPLSAIVLSTKYQRKSAKLTTMLTHGSITSSNSLEK